jgi:sterol desaturase/sphingolipid hydroxylase (fatty acid hydroxylase superfamily)
MASWIEALLPIGTGIALAGLIGLELTAPGFRAGGAGEDRDRVRRNWSFFVAAMITMAMVRLVGEALRARVPALIVWPSAIADAIVCFFVAELLGWISHWLKHRHAWLWRFHVQHHREPHYDMWLITHTHALEVMISGVATTTVLLLLGFSPFSMQLYFSVYTVAKAYQHSSHPLSLGPLDRFLVGPAYHRQHHLVGASTSFGIVTTAFDVLFRTAKWPRPERATEGYGAPDEPYGFAEEMVYFAKPEPRRAEPITPAACITPGP